MESRSQLDSTIVLLFREGLWRPEYVKGRTMYTTTVESKSAQGIQIHTTLASALQLDLIRNISPTFSDIGSSNTKSSPWGIQFIFDAIADFTASEGDLPDDVAIRPQIRARAVHEVAPVAAIPLDTAREMMRAAARDYFENYKDNTENTLLLVKAKPGVGKTTMSVEFVEYLVEERGLRILYLGPRHDFFPDITEISKQPDDWFEWLGRKHTDAEGLPDMCLYPADIDKWMAKGYTSDKFCSGICGWDFMQNRCAYHKQKKQAGKLVFGQHAHLWTGLPDGPHRPFDLIVCDENLMDAMLWRWSIPADFVAPPGLPIDESSTELIHKLANLVIDNKKYEEEKRKFEGEELLNALGGATYVCKMLENCTLDASVMMEIPRIHNVADVEKVPYGHLFSLIPMLLHEAKLSEAGTPGISRVIIEGGNLILLQRHKINEKYTDLPLIVLDGTANERIYESLLQRKVIAVNPLVEMTGKVYQVWNYANGVSTIIDKDGEPITRKIGILQDDINFITKKHHYKQVGLMSFKDIVPFFKANVKKHFYGARGTNEFVGCDVMIVAGSPMPNQEKIIEMAKMTFVERDEPFDTTWTQRYVPYTGQPTEVLVSGFWNDPDLNAVLQQKREAEIEQAAHRGRSITRDCDIWLLTNIPIADLPPAELQAEYQVQDAPADVGLQHWNQFLIFTDEKFQNQAPVLSTEAAKHLKMSTRMIGTYLERLVEHQPERWQLGTVPQKRGRPITAAIPQNG